jgi:putative ABC transport system substrate-binding protein
MRRREFVAMLGAGAALPFGARAQQRQLSLGFLIANTDRSSYQGRFEAEMSRLGYMPGRNLRVEFRAAASRGDVLAALAEELVRLKVDVIVAWFTPAIRAAQRATKQIPIVMVGAGDPVATGLVASISRPGGNTTGLASATAELSAKNVELMRELVPNAKKLSVLANPADPFTKTFLAQIELAASQQGFGCAQIMVDGDEQLDAAFAQLAGDGTQAVIVQPTLGSKKAASLALKARLPAAQPADTFASDGGLLAYSGKVSDNLRLAAEYVDKIWKGAAPADLPVQLPTQFDLRINAKTARELGLTVPPAILARADEVIE